MLSVSKNAAYIQVDSLQQLVRKINKRNSGSSPMVAHMMTTGGLHGR